MDPCFHVRALRGALEALEQLDPRSRMQWLLTLVSAHGGASTSGSTSSSSREGGQVLLRVFEAAVQHVNEFTNQQVWACTSPACGAAWLVA